MLHVRAVPDHAADAIEQLGTKPKFWFRSDDGGDYLFKETRANTGEDWSEKVASELCGFLGLPHVEYDLAVWKGKRGVVSRTCIPVGGRLDLSFPVPTLAVQALPLIVQPVFLEAPTCFVGTPSELVLVDARF